MIRGSWAFVQQGSSLERILDVYSFAHADKQMLWVPYRERRVWQSQSGILHVRGSLSAVASTRIRSGSPVSGGTVPNPQ